MLPLTPFEANSQGVVVDSTLAYRCDIYRPGPGTVDADNQPIPGEMALFYSNVPCFYYEQSAQATQGGEVFTDTEGYTLMQHHLLVTRTLDVDKDDEIMNVRNIHGEVIAGKHRISAVYTTFSQKHLFIEQIQ